MLNLEKTIEYTLEEKEMIGSLDLASGGTWKKRTNAMKELKERLRKELDILQEGRCAYCGNVLYVTSALEIEHIAPKGKDLYPEFTFHCKNLVAACSYCNGCHKKHAKDVVSKRDSEYEKCEFKIVHPYLDNPNDHILWTDDRKVIIEKASSSSKGQFTISLFGLEEPPHTFQRIQDYNLRKQLKGTPYEGKRLSNEEIAQLLVELV